MIPRAEKVIEKIADTQYRVITEKGRNKPYTLDTLFTIPKEHSAEGLGAEFQQFMNKLNQEGRELTIWKSILFFRFRLIVHFLSLALAFGTEIMVILLIKIYLSWVNSKEKDRKLAEGFGLLTSLLGVTFFRLLGCFKANISSELSAISYLNCLSV